MVLYEMMIGIRASIEGLIWCTDGSFVDPSMFQSSGKEAYGYALNSSTVVRITRSLGLAWSPIDSPFYSRMTGAQSSTDGVANSEYLKSMDGFSSFNCPAVHYACTQVNAGKVSYMPSSDELSTLYWSIMCGNMRSDLIAAELYESCNYRLDIYGSKSADSGSWNSICSSSQDLYISYYVCRVRYDGHQRVCYKDDWDNCVIPFFKV